MARISHSYYGGTGPKIPGRYLKRNPRGHQRLEQLCKAASSLNKEKGERHLQGEEEVVESREWRRRPRKEGQVSKREGSEVPRGKATARSRAQSGLRRCWWWEVVREGIDQAT